MELTKADIDALRFTCVQGRYYNAREVDACLDALAEKAEAMAAEMEQLRKKAAVYDALRQKLEARYARPAQADAGAEETPEPQTDSPTCTE